MKYYLLQSVMKKTALLFLIFIFAKSHAQVITFTDANFKARLLSANSINQIALDLYGNPTVIDTNNNGEIEVSEAEGISYLDISSNNYPANQKITYLNQISYFVNLTNLNCAYNTITSLNISSLKSIDTFNCSNNAITSLNIQGLKNIFELDCSNNRIASLNINLLSNLQVLDCSSNQLQSLNIQGKTKLEVVNCYNNRISSLTIQGLINLQYIDCTNNNIAALNVQGLTNLEYLYCSNNQITSLNVQGLTSLIDINCSNNQITAINVQGLTHLQYLDCPYNQIPLLNVQGLTNLKWIDCSHNQLSSISVQGLIHIQFLGCSNNQLTNLDISDLSLINYLDCSTNNLNTLNVKCGNANWTLYNIDNRLYFDQNPNLQYICADDDGDVALVQQKINDYGYTNCHVNSYCSFTPGGNYYSINGTNRYDNNNNGCDALDSAYPNLKLNIDNGTTSGGLIADSSGTYFYNVQAGTYSISPQLENPTYFNVSPTGPVSVNFASQASPFTQNYCITPNGTHHDLEVLLIPIDEARPGFDVSYKIKYKNKGTSTETSVLNFTFNNSVMNFSNASTSPNSQNAGNLIWNLGTIAPFQSGEITLSFHLNAPTDTPALNNGDVLNYSVVINGLFTDETPTDNSFNVSQKVVNSYDPNDKSCLEGSSVNSSIIGQYVHYKIRFENTGTFAAQNIVVMDRIDTSKFDISSLQMVSSSHHCYTRITGNKVEFVFENINLPLDDAHNNGYVVFKIKTVSTLTPDSSFSNTANIYFDYNPAIVTNTATTTITTLDTSDFAFESLLSFAPNPVKDTMEISNKRNLKISSASIYNMLGQLMMIVTDPTTITVSDLKTGTYLIKITTNQGSSSAKFIKE
jgi:uncharacterized repeat protein (TIGR01451 family)